MLAGCSVILLGTALVGAKKVPKKVPDLFSRRQ
jgi:hypothetical protein